MHLKEKICKHNSVLGYRIDAYFHKYKLAIEVDEVTMIEILMMKYKSNKH